MSHNSTSSFPRGLLLGMIALLAMVSPAMAQDQPPAKGDRTLAETATSPSSPGAALPNGASSINETYGDWSVACQIDEGRKNCVLSQAQGDSETGQRLFAVELKAPTGGTTDGVLLLPFGLSLDDGVKLKIDDQNLGKGARFSTCYPQGCIVPVSFPSVATDAMKKGNSLIITATNVSGGDQVPTFTVSLAGFTAAMNRIGGLAK